MMYYQSDQLEVWPQFKIEQEAEDWERRKKLEKTKD
jgi:hypothetical protein